MYQERIQDKKKQQMILHDLSSNQYEEDKKQELLKEYLILNNKISQSYISLTKEFDFIDNFILTKQGTITTHNTTYKEKIKKKKQLVVLSEESNLLPELQGMDMNSKNKNRLNLIVAYRDPGDGSRKQQLDIFVEQMKLIFDSQTDLHIYIIEQEGERDDYESLPELLQQEKSRMAKFNLGILKNIGFSIASTLSKSKKNSYYILSDVDLLPSKQLIDDYLKYPVKPIHLGNKGTRYNMDGNDSQFLGGVLSVNKNDFEKANGYPNNFWGWGGEDNALNRRFKDTKIKIVKPSSPVIDLETLTLKEKLDKLRNEKTKEMRKREKLDEDKKSWKENGLSNLDDLYEITSKQKEGNVTHYKVLLLVETTPLTKELSPLKFTSGNQTERYEVGDEIGYTPASPK
jgi:hypothetical protein